MKIIVDIQGAQSASRFRGIGRHTLAFTEALVERAGNHELWLAMNGALPDAIDSLRNVFATKLPKERLLVWRGLADTAAINPANDWRRNAAERLRESFLANLRPDMVHVTSLFEGVVDDAAVSIGRQTRVPTSLTMYDLIPLASPERYLTHPAVNSHYQRCITNARRADMWLAISEAARAECIHLLNLPADSVVNISSAADSRFQQIGMGADAIEKLRLRYGLHKPFVMYTGALASNDPRKNLDRLLGAFAALDPAVRKQHQLLIVAPAEDWEIRELRAAAAKRGCNDREVVVAPHVPDADLIALYNNCKVFCFPSLHEGFGLPALEAMQCGAAVIGSNIPSISEVIGRHDALFDPKSEPSITRLMNRVLTDEAFRMELSGHGLARAKAFSWDESAKRAVEGFEELHARKSAWQRKTSVAARPALPKLAFLSPLPPEASGISDYSADLLPELARHYEIDVIVDQPRIDADWINANCNVRDVAWFNMHASEYDRIVYQFGNSPFHSHMFDLLPTHPGVVVLHDFFLSSVTSFLELHGGRKGFWRTALYESHGYGAVADWVATQDVEEARYKYPTNFSVIANSAGVIVHSAYSKHLAAKMYGAEVAASWNIVPQMRSLAPVKDRTGARSRLGIAEDDFVVCSFGHMDPTKLNTELIESWSKSSLVADRKARLLFVGGRHGGEYGKGIDEQIKSLHSDGQRISITGFVTADAYDDYLQAADVAVQLRTKSRGETSRAILDSLAYGLPSIVNAHGPMVELPDTALISMPDQFTGAELARHLEAFRSQPELRVGYSEMATNYVAQQLSPRKVADMYRDAIEEFYRNGAQALRRDVTETVGAYAGSPTYADFSNFARALNSDVPLPLPAHRMFVDVSANAATTLKSGIERVVTNQVQTLLASPPPGYRVEPVRLVNVGGQQRYVYARAYVTSLLQLGPDLPSDEIVEVAAGDIFYCADYSPEGVIVASQQGLYAAWRRCGVRIVFNVYDLLPVTNPEWFPDFSHDIHLRWMEAISRDADQLVCISEDVAINMREWLSQQSSPHKPDVRSVHLGADFVDRNQSLGAQSRRELPEIPEAPTFIMVGTIEPRKGYLQTVQAFEKLWQKGVKANLIIVGTEGWRPLSEDQRGTIPRTVETIRQSKELNKQLFWFEGLDDWSLNELYKKAECLLAASEGEGFGLPLIEAAQHNLPILARDLRVFREIAGPHATYFTAANPAAMAKAIEDWLEAHSQAQHTASEKMPWLTWAQSISALKATILGDDKYIRGQAQVWRSSATEQR